MSVPTFESYNAWVERHAFRIRDKFMDPSLVRLLFAANPSANKLAHLLYASDGIDDAEELAHLYFESFDHMTIPTMVTLMAVMIEEEPPHRPDPHEPR